MRLRMWVLTATLLFLLSCREAQHGKSELAPLEGLGGTFVLTGTDGRPFDFADLRGKTVILFFGYTACPDACPTTLARLSRVYEDLRKKKLEDRVRTVFISVDPERDTPQKIGEYLDYFSVKTIGLTGTNEELKAVAKKYGASFERNPSESGNGYLMDHTTYVYLIDGFGRVRSLIRPEDPPEKIARHVSTLANEACCKPKAGTPLGR